MYPDDYYKEEVLIEMEQDYDLIVYFGHGIPEGWTGFSFISCKDLSKLDNKRPDRIVLSFSCYSLHETDTCIGRTLIDTSYAGIIAGYKSKIRHEDNLHNLNRIMDAIVENKTLSVEDLSDMEIMRSD